MKRWLYGLKRWMYRGDRPGMLARAMNRAGGEAVLRRREGRRVKLAEVAPDERAPILRRYLALAPGARPHVPIDRHAPLADFERVAASHPVFRIDE